VGLIVIYSNIAKQDLKEIYNYIRRDSIRYALREIKSIRFAIQKLKLNPLIGKKFEKSDDEFTRELIFKNYRVVYDIVLNKQIIILTIHHDARLLTNNPAFQDEE
jgi:plasmid stabilization system protein ParE